jgi:hypothetical protein
LKLNEFSDAVRQTPIFVPVFRVIKVPTWARDRVAVGDLLVYEARRGSLRTRKGNGINLGASYVEFFEYQTPQEWK